MAKNSLIGNGACLGNTRYPLSGKAGVKVKKEVLYHVEINDGEYAPVYREDLESKNGFHNWWYKLLKTDDAPTGFHDKNGHQIRLKDVLIVPHFDFYDKQTSWSVVVAMVPEKYSRFEKEKVVFKTLHIGWDHRIVAGKPQNGRSSMTDYTDECIYVGKLEEFVDELGYLVDYGKIIQSPDGNPVS